MKLKSTLLIFILFSSIVSLNALSYKVSYLTADNGLSRNHVNHIFRDTRGFMWISTSKGLDRFDGYDFIHYNSRNSENPLISDNVSCIEEDRNGDLWIGTENGLYFMNYKTGEISNADEKLDTKLEIRSKSISFIKKDDQGDIWIGYETGLVRLHYISVNKIQEDEIYKTTSTVTAFLHFNGNIYVADNNKIFRLINLII